eukprot:6273745-Prymnesium_polylepis.1
MNPRAPAHVPRCAARCCAIWPWMYRLSVDRQQLGHTSTPALSPHGSSLNNCGYEMPMSSI